METGVKSKLKNWFGLVQHNAGQIFYNYPQTYKVRYEAAIKNTAGERNSLYIVLPIPPNTVYQKISKEPQFFPENAVLGEEPKFGNRYAYWQTELASNESKVFREEFTVTVSPRKAIIDESLTLDDYNLTSYDLVRFQNAYVDAGDERIKSIVKSVVGEERRVKEVIRLLNEYVISHLVYGNPIKGLYSSKDALEKSKVDCGGFDTLLAALCISAGIPARIVSGFWAGFDKNDMHAWLEIVLPNRGSTPADPSIEHLRRQGKTQKSGELGFVGSDRIVMSVGCEIPLTVGGKSFRADILQNPVILTEKNKSQLISDTKFITAK